MNLPLISNVLIPSVVWSQTDNSVTIKIHLLDVKKYSLTVGYDELTFSTIKDEKNYYLTIKLFGCVIPEKTFHKNLGREIRITLIKAQKFAKWLRLESKPGKNPFIKVDYEAIQEFEKEKIDTTDPKYWEKFDKYRHRFMSSYEVEMDRWDSDNDESDDERFCCVDDVS